MKKYFNKVLLQLIFTVSFLSLANAQVKKEASVNITGEITKPYVLTLSDFAKMPRVEIIRKDRDDKDHQYSGVLLTDLLIKAGATMGKELRGNNLTKYVMVEASDGYRIIFSLAELDPQFSDDKIILTNTMDKKPLPVADGPFRIIVQNETKPARCIKQVTSIKIGFAK
ncbi:molybdopterin-binding protein [Pedobacter sp. Leaf216]|uniref:molybdopterin-dependent oxidoreductase n=1 Tax=Pedobacter sp. Leaf216 TaxID=1735684 RepID=UPI0006FA3567|nr:molybdopterin-dependent oxidoreductase [Pedobacter sp. Leaf216]KQM72636.1 molybdopterin-binding protein [Pedobacter sp. Leaf216]